MSELLQSLAKVFNETGVLGFLIIVISTICIFLVMKTMKLVEQNNKSTVERISKTLEEITRLVSEYNDVLIGLSAYLQTLLSIFIADDDIVNYVKENARKKINQKTLIEELLDQQISKERKEK